MREWDRLTRRLIINVGGSYYFKRNGYFTAIISGATTGCHCFTLIIDWPPQSGEGLSATREENEQNPGELYQLSVVYAIVFLFSLFFLNLAAI